MFPEDEGKRENDFLFPSLVICLRPGIDIQPLCDTPNEGKAAWFLGIAVFRGHAGQPADVRQVQGLRDAWSFGTAAFPKCIPDRLSLCWRPNEGKAGWSLGIAVFRGGLPDKLPLCGRPIHSCHLPISVLTWTG